MILNGNKHHGLAQVAGTLGFDGALIEKQPLEEIEWHAFAVNFDETSCKVFEDKLRILYAFHKCP
jgi:hypothetical protein